MRTLLKYAASGFLSFLLAIIAELFVLAQGGDEQSYAEISFIPGWHISKSTQDLVFIVIAGLIIWALIDLLRSASASMNPRRFKAIFAAVSLLGLISGIVFFVLGSSFSFSLV